MSHFTVLVIGEDVDEQLAPFQENNMDNCPEEYLEFVEDEDSEPDEKTGKRGYWENPNRKWDWYVIGGRWTGMLKLKPNAEGEIGEPGTFNEPAEGGYCDSALIKDIDFEGMQKESAAEREENWADYQKALKAKEDLTWRRITMGINDKTTKESYMARSTFSTFAVLMNGKWYQKGEMGWFGVASDEKDQDKWQDEFDKLLKELPPDTRITIVDCHI